MASGGVQRGWAFSSTVGGVRRSPGRDEVVGDRLVDRDDGVGRRTQRRSRRRYQASSGRGHAVVVVRLEDHVDDVVDDPRRRGPRRRAARARSSATGIVRMPNAWYRSAGGRSRRRVVHQPRTWTGHASALTARWIQPPIGPNRRRRRPAAAGHLRRVGRPAAASVGSGGSRSSPSRSSAGAPSPVVAAISTS